MCQLNNPEASSGILSKEVNNSRKVFFGHGQFNIDGVMVYLDTGFRPHYTLRGKMREDKLTLKGCRFNMLKRTVCRVFCFFSLFAFFLSVGICTSYAHPHVFIDSWITGVFDNKGLAGFNIRWAFDEMFSSMIIMDFDLNHNRRFEASEIEDIKKNAFLHLKEFDFFTHIKIGKKPFQVKYVKDFSTEIKNNRIFYHFFVPCHVRAVRQWKEVRISVYDEKYYTDVLPGKAPLKLTNQESFEVRHRFRQNKSEAYFFEQIFPYEAAISFRLKNV